MRFFEIISISTLLLTLFFVSFFPKRKLFRYCFLCSAFTLIFHVMFEGVRWQMSFVYIVIPLFTTVFLVKNKFIIKLVIGISIFFVAVSTFFSLFLPVFTFNKLTGHYGIGTNTYYFVDDTRNELFCEDSSRKREIIFQIWYPTTLHGNDKFISYLENTPELPHEISKLFGYPKFLFTHLKYVKTSAVKDANISSEKNNYPVLIYHSGLYGSRKFNTFQIQELVSHGYIVAGLDNPGAVALTEFSDGRKIGSLPMNEMQALIHQSLEDLPIIPKLNGVEMKDGIIPYFSHDISFVIDCLEKININDSFKILTHAIDTSKIGVFGVSLGGIVVAEAAAKDKRIKACLIMESPMTKYVIKNGLGIPTMIMTRDAGTMRMEREKSGGWTEKDIHQHLFTMTNIYDRLPGDGYFIQIPGMFHIEFLDIPLWLSYGKYFGLTGTRETNEVHNLINAFSINFFDKEIEGKKSRFLNNPNKTFPNIIYKKKYKNHNSTAYNR